VIDGETLEQLYNKYNDRRFVHPDPLEFLYSYNDIKEREIAGLIASSLAYGQVKQILKSVSRILSTLGPHPSTFLKKTSQLEIENEFRDFKHRFTTGMEISALLLNIGQVLKKYGSLYECFLSGFNKEKKYLPALLNLIKELRLGECNCYNSLIPMPGGKCAYKRMNLFMRWMVRKDNVDPGGWDSIPASSLIIPLDVHMHRVSLKYGFTERKQADMASALQITEKLKRFCPEDPVKYDFALTRPGIHSKNKL
jgi:uncharacterized protein (TIGR02757 family)